MVEQKLEAVAELCGRVVALAHGRILADGTPTQVFNHAAVQQQVGAPIYARLAAGFGLPAPWPITFETAVRAFNA